MRGIEGRLTDCLERHVGNQRIAGTEPYLVKDYSQLVREVAKLAYLNKDYLLFYRGQNKDYKNRGGSSTFYPTIYRGNYLKKHEVRYRFEILDAAGKRLVNEFKSNNINGEREVKRKKHVRWGILQHYEVCDTPLLDFTHSLRVASSFALMENNNSYGHVSIFGLPYITNRITIDSEYDLANVRLLSICPPDALRPYFQEGYLAGTTDLTTEYRSKSELDFNRRLVAKFKIPNDRSFWEQNSRPIQKDLLLPKEDRIRKICNLIKSDVQRNLEPGRIGQFVKEWTELEQSLLNKARKDDSRVYSIREAINQLTNWGPVERNLHRIDAIRKFRNRVVHEPEEIQPSKLEEFLQELREVKHDL